MPSSPRPRLTNTRYRVVIGDPDDEATWAELEVQSIQPDLFRAEELAARQKIKPQERPMVFGAMVVWAALSRTKQLGEEPVSFEQFKASLIEQDDAGRETADPTQTEPDTA